MEGLGISLEAVRDHVEEIIGRGEREPSGHIPFTPRAKKVLELALRAALDLHHTYIGTEHLLLALVREDKGVAAQVLQELGVELEDVSTAVMPLLQPQVEKTTRPGSLRSEAPVAAPLTLKIAVPQELGKAFDELMAHQGEADYDLLLARFLERVARRLRNEAARK